MTNPARLITIAMVCGMLGCAARSARADDIDIFLGNSGGTGDAPTVMFLLDNSTNWSKQSQAWTTGPQGYAEIEALISVLQSLRSSPQPINIGLAMLTSNRGGYIRFAARDVTNAANNQALQNILNYLSNNINNPIEKINTAARDETAALYELWKYYSGLPPYRGGITNAPLVDVEGNTGGGPLGPSGITAFAQGLTSGFAIDDGVYQSPLGEHPCGAGYIVFIANNSKGGGFDVTENVYQSSVVPALTAVAATPSSTVDTWTDEWTQFIFRSGAKVPNSQTNGSIVTYILDAWDSQPDKAYSASLQSAAKDGGGRYYQVGSQAAVTNALLTIVTEIQSVNATFSSASVPINATTRSQSLNEVFIPTFRPDATDQPRWYGNLKRFQLANASGHVDLVGPDGSPVANLLTGFIGDCAQSFWTSDSTDPVNFPLGYWNYPPESVYAKGRCATSPYSPYSDFPDGAVVEKGGVAEVIRKGNFPPATTTNPTWLPTQRNVLTLSGLSSTTLVPFNATSTGLPLSLVNWLLGQDVLDENANGNLLESRPSLHGDSIHSRPLPVNYADGSVIVFYGSNDGMLRAVDGATGREVWAFVAPEFYNPAPAVYTMVNGVGNGVVPTGFERLMWSGTSDVAGNQISPLVKVFGISTSLQPTPAPKDYYFDGSIGLYQSADSSTMWIYPSMRRGGRMIYAMDVSSPGSPRVMWKTGCPSVTSDTGCAPGMSGIGQTWSMPVVAATIQGYNSPVVIIGGGYDACEDANIATPSCSSEKGSVVYVLDAQTGNLIKSFPALRAVAGDVALIASMTAGVVDHAYAADTGGNLYRIDFGTSTDSWVMHRVAFTNNAGRKFLYSPAVLAVGSQVYVAIGSGDREHPLYNQYPYSTVLNRFYVYIDSLAYSPVNQLTGGTNLDDPSVMSDVTATTTCSTPGVLPSSAMKGWFMNLNQHGQGEQTVTSAVIAAGLVAFSTNRPLPPAAGTCTNSLGQANGYWVNLLNASGAIGGAGESCGGSRSTAFPGGGLPPSPVLTRVPVDGQLMQIVIGAVDLTGSASTVISPQLLRPSIVPTRKLIYWKSSGEN